MIKACPVLGKRKSVDICNAFIAGAPYDQEGTVFYGVDSSNASTWRAVKARQEPWYYIDNSYFDSVRGVQYRVTLNCLQHSGAGQTDGSRWDALGITLKPWRSGGDHIVVVEQSKSFMREVVGDADWFEKKVQHLTVNQPRPLRLRRWSSDKMGLSVSLQQDLLNAWALVTHSSAAAIMAIIAGIPAICDAGPVSMNGSSALDPLFNIERDRIFGVLADNQWTLDELRAGAFWK